jgi:hypothetical protein
MAKYVKGLFKDTAPEDQPEGTWRYAKNITMHPLDGALTVEPGIDHLEVINDGSLQVNNNDVYIDNIPSAVLPRFSVVVGAIEITDDRVILFITYDWVIIEQIVDWSDVMEQGAQLENLQEIIDLWNNGRPRYTAEIGEFDGRLYKKLYRPQVNFENILPPHPTQLDLNFNTNYFIEGTYKKNPDGDLFVYWTDDLNPPRVMNITRQKEWLIDGTIQSGPNQGQNIAVPDRIEYLYGIDWENTTNPRHKDLLNLFPSSGPVPHIDLEDVNPGGGLLTGVYFLALAYVDQDLVQTNYVVIANPVSIVDDNEGVLPIERYDGAPPKLPSGKAISWKVFNLNTDYEYLRPAVIRKSDGATQAFKLNDVPIQNLVNVDNNGNLEDNIIVFTGLEGYSELAVEDVIVDTVSYDTAKTMDQLDSVLYLGNVKGSKDLGYQKYANYIKLDPLIKVFDPFDPHEVTEDVLNHNYIETDPYGWNFATSPINNGYRWNENIFKFKGYTRDEVYAFYISFIMHDGTESYAYHIPGRAPLLISPGEVVSDADLIPTWNNDPNANTNIFSINEAIWESGDILNPGLLQVSDTKGRIFHFYETSMLPNSRNMNFWQNRNEFYPSDVLNRDNWEVWDASDEFSNVMYAGEINLNLSGRRVRHHHFPSNENVDFQVMGTSSNTMEIDNLGNLWYGLEFGSCTSRVDRSGISADDMMDQSGITDGEIQSLTDSSGIVDFYDDLFNLWGGDEEDFITARYADGQEESMGWVWPEIGQVISYAYIKDKGYRGITDYRFARLYNPTAMYGSTAGVMDVPGTDSDFPGNWTSGVCVTGMGTEDVYQQGGALSPDMQADAGGPENGNGDTAGCNGGDHSIYWHVGCMHCGNESDFVEGGGWSLSGNWGGCAGPHSEPCYNGGNWDCDDWKEPTVVWANDTGTDNLLVFWNDGSYYPWTDAFFDTDRCDLMIWWKRERIFVRGALLHSVRPLGFSLDDLKVPQEIWDKTQGFRIYYANREHSDKRVLGQNIFHPYTPSLQPSFPQCISAATLGLDELENSGLYQGDGGPNKNKEKWWVNYPYTAGPANYESAFEARGDRFMEYQMFSFHDFHLMRTRNNIAAATHTKMEYVVDMMAWAGPGTSNDCDPETVDGSPSAFSWNGESQTDEEGNNIMTASAGLQDCWEQCLSGSAITSGFHIGLHYYNATEIASCPDLGATGQVSLYQWFLNFDPNTGSIGDLNRPIKERAKSYVDGDSILSGKQLGFGYKAFNEFGESHIAVMLHERYGILPAFHNTEVDPAAQPTGIMQNSGGNTPIQYTSTGLGQDGTRRNFAYQGNLHAFRQDMYNSIDTQDLVWTGFQVIGEAYKGFLATDKTAPTVIYGEEMDESDDKYNTINVFNFFSDPDRLTNTDTSAEFISVANRVNEMGQNGEIFGGDTYITRHGWRKTLRPNLFVDGGAFYPALASVMGRDMRFVYETIVESTDNINFRHVEHKHQIYWPGATIKELIISDNEIDLTHEDNMGYSADYSSVNDVGHTVPLPLQIAQPSEFPTRVIRSTQGDDSSLVDSYRVFLANQFKDLLKNRGDLWKISIFNNLLYFHMEDTILRTKGKQNLQLADKSEAFVGSGDIFAQVPDELVQTDAGFGGTQSQFACVTSKYGYFYLNQKNRSVYMITDKITNISSLGLEKWFQENIPYAIEHYGAHVPRDNPYTFGFTATWDQRYQRILLTKRELIPTRTFREYYHAGNIYYNLDEECFYFRETTNDPWSKLEYSYFPQCAINTVQNGTLNSVQWDFATYPPPNPYYPGTQQWEDSGGVNWNPTNAQTLLGWTPTQIATGILTPSSEPWAWVWSLPEGVVMADGYIPTVMEPTFDCNTFFEPSGWSISYNPELNIWVSFHDDISYKYTYIGEALYSFGDFAYQNPNRFEWTLDGAPFSTNTWIGDRFWLHHAPKDFISFTANSMPFFRYDAGERFGLRYTSEIEVIHNEENTTNKVFHNFSFDTNVLQYNHDDEVLMNPEQTTISNMGTNGGVIDDMYHYIPTIELFEPGFDSFIVWNSHQCSGEIDFVYHNNDGFSSSLSPQGNQQGWSTIGNLRKNASDWSVSKFRDIVRDSGDMTGLTITNENVFNVPQVYETLIEGNAFETRGRAMWIASGMTEMLNPYILNTQKCIKDPGRKFVDKWIAIRLICRSREKIVNLLSTKVGARKYHRHEK